MASVWQALLSCCLGRSKPAQPQELPGEQQPLLDPDVLPQVSTRPVRSTEEQLAEQEALRSILARATERFVSISSPHPFASSSTGATTTKPSSSRSPPLRRSQLSTDSQQTRRTAPSRSSSTYKAPHDAPVRVMHLGTAFETYSSSRGARAVRDVQNGEANGRPTSAHTMRTIKKRGQVEGREGDEEVESQYGTMRSYMTAREHDEVEGYEASNPSEEMTPELREALARIEEQVQHLVLQDVGPIVEDLQSD